MTKENPPAIDPRYDPVYQRGFAGSAARIRAVEAPRQERLAPRPEPGRSYRPSEEHSDPFVVPPARSAALDEPTPDEPASQVAGETPTTAPGLVLRGNPWVATLWVVGVLLITAGFFGTWRSQSVYVGATPPDDMNDIVVMEVLDLLSPPLMLVGLLVIAGVLFLHAVAWRTRRLENEDEEA